MTARLTLLLRKIQTAMNDGKTFDEAIAGYLLTPAEVEELWAACGAIASRSRTTPCSTAP